ncbi:MAG: FAD-dependent oxidoreductase, partial [archaeon]|nr:FAD-dependent oxidoreductase [archaeon]
MVESTIDLAIIGSGAAGITAGIYAARRNLKVRIFEKEAVGGQGALAIWIENYPGTKKMKGEEMMAEWASHLEEFGIEVEEANGIKSVKKVGEGF